MADRPSSASEVAAAGEYTVIARRYRPQTFAELIGQEHIAQALSNAISTSRVGHAYLFTGARGVGKTSAARILAKALNCAQGPSPVPCNRCDVCESIGSGEDIDVLEIDGASNRGIDEIRQLRQNVNVRPSRARLKIYIIDEVHMLTREAFNALLKTLEEPPEHVKFIFCTTEPTKIPVTILSRCQRFDFAGILGGSISRRLRQIVDAEGVQAEPDALELLARRAAGSMRDGQSLLEQLLAFASGRITADDVHRMLGTAGDHRLAELVGHLADRDAAAALAGLDAALHDGVDTAQLLEQLCGYFRDCLAAAVGCPADLLLYATPGSHPEVAELGKRLGLTTVLAVTQILDQTLARLRYSTQGRILAELALVRICALEDLDELPSVIAQLQTAPTGQGARGEGRGTSGEGRGAGGEGRAARGQGPVARSEGGVDRSSIINHQSSIVSSQPLAAAPNPASAPSPERPALELTPENAAGVWTRTLATMSGMVVEQAKQYDRVELCPPDRLVIFIKPEYAFVKSSCERPEHVTRFQQALAEVTGREVRVEFRVQQPPDGSAAAAPPSRPVSPQQRLTDVAQHPLIRRASELFGAQPVRVDEPPEPK